MSKLTNSLQGRQLRVINTDLVHQRIHEGLFFSLSEIDTSLPNNASLDILIQVDPSSGLHIRFNARAGGDAQGFIYEGTTFSAAGSVLAPINRNRFSQNVPPATFTRDPTITDLGTELYAELLAGGSGFLTPGGEASTFEEFVLKGGETYLVRLTNTSGSAQPVNAVFDFYDGRTTVV